ncbi:hypothetical protein Tco_1552749, partial [Tanacetum coccineum]
LTPQLHESAGGLPSLKLSLHSCSLPGSTNAMGIETSIALVLPAREHECNTSFVLGRPPALSVLLEWRERFEEEALMEVKPSYMGNKESVQGTLIARNIDASTHVCCEAALRNELENWMLAL